MEIQEHSTTIININKYTLVICHSIWPTKGKNTGSNLLLNSWVFLFVRLFFVCFFSLTIIFFEECNQFSVLTAITAKHWLINHTELLWVNLKKDRFPFHWAKGFICVCKMIDNLEENSCKFTYYIYIFSTDIIKLL